MNDFLEDGPKNPLKIQDNTFRDGHQSLLATRMRTEDMIPIAEKMDEIGFWAMEVWGGATFDTMHRFLAEDPFDRVRILKKYIKKTPFSMLLRGQNLVGYRNYADDVARLFVDKACEVGMDVFRVFDALNDFRNFETVVERIKANGKHFQGTICYSLTQRRMGGEVFNLEYYVNKAKEIEAMGADTLCLKDMAGIMAPFDIAKIVTELKKQISIPIHLHTHYTSGMASMVYLEAIKAGVDIVDTCLAPFALRTSQPAIEPIVATLYGTTRDPGLDLNKLLELGDHIEAVAPKYRDYLAKHKMSVIDTSVLVHQVPGGMISNLVNQLKEAKALHRLPEVYREVAVTRKELGTPPLVTPTSQIVGVQAVLNVLFGKYKMVTNEVKDLVYGLYGKTPAPVDPEVREKVLKGYKRGQTPVTGRAADYLEPELEAVREKAGDLVKDDFDLLIVALYPTTGMQFLKWKYGLEEKPPEVRPKTLEDIRKEDEAMAAAIEQVCKTM
ncbi:MAG: pyruvate carboxylase subunit B [Deltaproteobacteria bacterium]|nr:pyruvate carboxylase subunit B [Deltaproteobacteria bacterium]MBW1923742.1 pyruvate carboxylase subunit B [Deltaproteobacteria bacterium]MBW1949003.1 pyruvate carboxylase subunit B [Deltaproteobacteria bacterium]MBW2007007.1 pyruvate carboxylase subunit B [Deltaproteobacteria bacterium]MBW2101632.1 pyruvate carboxylase subunit B [Deltaproteobacteria bacterium]